MEAAGRYYRAPDGTPPYPGWHLLGSRNWTKGEQQVDVILGESRQATQRWDNGATPEPRPVPQLLGEESCIADGEINLPPKRWELTHSEQSGGEVFIEALTTWPSTVFSWGGNLPGCCLPVLADDDHVVLADVDNAVLALCMCECLPVLADDDNPVLASCPQCLPVLDDDDLVVLADDDHAVEASC